MNTTVQIVVDDDFITIDLADRDTWPASFNPQALYTEAAAAGDIDLCDAIEHLGLDR